MDENQNKYNRAKALLSTIMMAVILLLNLFIIRFACYFFVNDKGWIDLYDVNPIGVAIGIAIAFLAMYIIHVNYKNYISYYFDKRKVILFCSIFFLIIETFRGSILSVIELFGAL